MNPEKFSVKSRFRSFLHAFNGLWLLLKSEHNARIHTL
ncbi:MAG TPA: diacylglycerol kinase, partial [Bacteroidales bacterium]|nr:diacylglycerol kinase [Bacteroidales bacterium]